MDREAVADVPTASPAAPARPDAVPSGAGGAADRAVLAVLCLASFLAVINFAAPAPFYPEIGRDLGVGVPLLGQVTTALTLCAAVLGLGIGPLADRYGHRWPMVVGVVAAGCNLLGTGLAPNYPTLLALAAVGGFGDAILLGLPLAIASVRFAGAARRRAVGMISAALPAGTVVGVPLLTAAGGVVGWRAIFVAAGLATFAAAALAAAWLPAESPARDGRLRVSALTDAYRPLLGSRPMLRLYAVSALRGAAWVGMLTYLGAFLAARFGFGPAEVGLAYAAAGAGVFLGSLAATRLLGRLRPRPLVAATTIAQGVLFGAVYALPLGAAAAVALLAPAAFVGAAAFVGLAMLLADETPGGAGTTMVLNGSVFNLGTAVGVALGGLLIALAGYPALGVGLPLFALAAGLLVLAPAEPRRAPAD